MATARLIILTVVAASIYMHLACAKVGTFYSANVRSDYHSSNTYSAQGHNVIAHRKRFLTKPGGHNPTNHQGTNTGHSPQTSHDFCLNYQEYVTLLQLKDQKSCLKSTEVWTILESLNQQYAEEGVICSIRVIRLLSDAFGHIDNSPDYCQCSGSVRLATFPNKDNAIYQNCSNSRISGINYYQILFEEYYREAENYKRQSTHHHIWYLLNQIPDFRCQQNLITNLAYTFTEYVPVLECHEVSSVQPSTQHADISSSFTTPLHTTTTTPMFTPAPTPTIAIQTCDKYATITSLAHGNVFSHPAADDCSQGDHRSSEALVFQLCHTTQTHNWTKGPAVMDMCAQIPLYTPVATFLHESFISNGGQAGIFLGCLPNGFKMAAQECFANSTVLHIENGGLLTRDPSIYHVVLF